MGFFTDAEIQQLRIESMILHVVSEDEFVPAPEQAVEHAEFFISRILDTDVAPVYQFKDLSRTRDCLQNIALGKVSFVSGAQNLSREFSREHDTTTRDGAFFIFELRTNVADVRIYSLIKYDYREAIEKSEDDNGGASLRRIIHAFIDDKKAIQKAALIRVVGGVAEELVATRDRTKIAPEIADYFAKFLDVQRNSSDDELNTRMVEALRKTFSECRDLLPKQDVAAALRNAKNVLRDRQLINEEAICESVIAAAGHPDNEQTKIRLRKITGQMLRAKRLAGLEFRPIKSVLRQSPMRKIRTAEGVTVLYPDEVSKVIFNRTQNANGLGETITITTEHIVEDTVVPNSTR